MVGKAVFITQMEKMVDTMAGVLVVIRPNTISATEPFMPTSAKRNDGTKVIASKYKGTNMMMLTKFIGAAKNINAMANCSQKHVYLKIVAVAIFVSRIGVRAMMMRWSFNRRTRYLTKVLGHKSPANIVIATVAKKAMVSVPCETFVLMAVMFWLLNAITKAAMPTMAIIIFCTMLPKSDKATACTFVCKGRWNALPTGSPMRAGVRFPQAKPAMVCCIEMRKDCRCVVPMSQCHLMVSR